MENLPCPPEIKNQCPIFDLEGECYEDRHHLYWPASEYSSRIEKQFRQLDSNKITICRWLHNTVHLVTLPPEKPTRNEMQRRINES